MAAGKGLWRDRPVLVTGASGFLGRHVIAALIDRGARPVAIVRDRAEPLAAGPVVVVEGDVTDPHLLERALGDYEVPTVLHLAAQSQVEVANRNPVETFESNVRGTWCVLEAARRSPLVEQVVVASSDKAYGTQPRLPYTEDMPLLAVHPYDVSKACADMIASSYHRVFGVPVCITRCGNLFGPGDTNEARVVPGTIRSLLCGERPVIRSDGSPVRDYLYVTEAVEGYLRLVEIMASDPTVLGEAFNLSAGQPLSVLDLVDRIARVMAVEGIDPDVRGTASHEISEQHLSSDKAQRRLGWAVGRSLDEALAETVAWYREQLTGR